MIPQDSGCQRKGEQVTIANYGMLKTGDKIFPRGSLSNWLPNNKYKWKWILLNISPKQFVNYQICEIHTYTHIHNDKK